MAKSTARLSALPLHYSTTIHKSTVDFHESPYITVKSKMWSMGAGWNRAGSAPFVSGELTSLGERDGISPGIRRIHSAAIDPHRKIPLFPGGRRARTALPAVHLANGAIAKSSPRVAADRIIDIGQAPDGAVHWDFPDIAPHSSTGINPSQRLSLLQGCVFLPRCDQHVSG